MEQCAFSGRRSMTRLQQGRSSKPATMELGTPLSAVLTIVHGQQRLVSSRLHGCLPARMRAMDMNGLSRVDGSYRSVAPLGIWNTWSWAAGAASAALSSIRQQAVAALQVGTIGRTY